LLGNLLAKPIVFSFRHEKSCSERWVIVSSIVTLC
jgi:hypothetical protein